MKRIFVPSPALFLTFFFLQSAYGQDIIINEFLFAPGSGEAEWIEIWNGSGSSISLQGWNIMDATYNPVRVTSETVVLPADEYLVLASSLPLASRWEQSAVRVLVVPGFPSLNNSGDEIILRDSTGKTIDSLRYEASWNSKKSSSVERRRPRLPFNQVNAGATLHPDGGTPGGRNSQTPPDFDLALDSLIIKENGFSVRVMNVGLRTPESAEVQMLCRTAGGDSAKVRVPFMPPEADEALLLDIALSCERTVSIQAVLRCEQDANAGNDSLARELHPPLRKGDVQFNEIMAAPLGGKAEWVELINRAESPLRLDGCSLAGAPGSNGLRSLLRLPNDLPMLPSGGYLLITSDSGVLVDWPYLREEQSCVVASLGRTSLGLGNTGEELLFLDAGGHVIDSIVYSETWHHPLAASTAGRSLELINTYLHAQGASAWTTCVHSSGGTPGRRNSVWSEAGASDHSSEQLVCTPNPFSPDGDGYEDHTLISWTLPSTASLLRLRIYDAAGRCIRTLLNNDVAGRKGVTVWDGLDSEGRRARVGVYVVLAEALDAWTNTVAVAKTAAVLATRL